MIYAHITGLMYSQKTRILEQFTNSKYLFKDVDEYTDLIMDDENMKKLILKYDYYIEKSKNVNISKAMTRQYMIKSRNLNNRINNYWKDRMEFYLDELYKESKENTTKYIILIGYLNFYRNVRITIKLNINIKIFINNDMNEYTREIIKTNLETYKDDIINGDFNLQLLSPEFLIKRRQTIQDIYIKNSYEHKTFLETLSILKNTLSNIIAPPILFYTSRYKYKSKIPLKQLTAYADEWTSIVSALNNKNIIKGYLNDNPDKPFIQELKKNTLNKINMKLYVYIITDTRMFVPIYTKNYIYKYKILQSPKINKIIEVESPINKLSELNIQIIKA